MPETKLPARYLITSALPYANGYKHIGHLAGAYLPADIYVRYLRAQGRDVAFVCGSDEHGTAIPIQATKEGTTPQAIIDKYHAVMEENFRDLGISFDIYHRTSSPLHHETAQEIFTYLRDRGELIQQESEQFYDAEAAQFLADRYIRGTCPNCGSDRAFGDQCEKCGTALSPDELINPKSTLSGATPVKRSTTHWYLPLDRHEAFLREWITENHATDWKPAVVGQCCSWIEAGLQPRAVTRDLDWGIAVPGEPGKVLYVWFDAPIGYISATKQWALNAGKDWAPYWQSPDTKLVHFIGKDNIVFHCIIFPIMLRQRGYIVPENVPAMEFMNLEGDKMSTSRGWKLDIEDYVQDFIRKDNGGPQMADALRYYLTSILPETKDSEFTWKGFGEAVNSELVGVFANFVNRTWVLMHKLCGGKVPRYHNEQRNVGDEALMEAIRQAPITVEKAIEEYRFRDALFAVIDLSRMGNRYLQECEPWIKDKLIQKSKEEIASSLAMTGQAAQSDAERADAELRMASAQVSIDNCIHLCLQLCANLAILSHPFLPNTARKLLGMMKVVESMLEWKNAGSLKLLSVGYSLRAPELLFRKIEDTEIVHQIEKLHVTLEKSKETAAIAGAAAAQTEQVSATIESTAAEKPVAKPEIGYDDFAKLDLRIGTVSAAEKVTKADKLLKLTVDMGTETRTIVSGVAQHFAPEDLVGKQVMVVANLAPRKMRGIESQGMILMAEDAGKLVLVAPNEAIAAGSGVS